MKNFKFISIFILLLFSLILVKGVEGVACSGAPIEDCTVGANTIYTMPYNATYNLNDSNTNGVIIINGNNTIIDCNYSSIYGNMTTNSVGIYDNGFSNITIKNCNGIYNYRFGIRLNGVVNNSYLYNNIFIGNCSYSCIYVTSQQNINIYNNTFIANGTSGQIIIEDTTMLGNTNIYNNSFINSPIRSIYLNPASNVNAYNNYFYNSTTVSININTGSKNNFINNNLFTELHNNTQVFISITGNNTRIFNNTFNGYNESLQASIYPANSKNTSIYGNYFNNSKVIISSTIYIIEGIKFYNNTIVNIPVQNIGLTLYNCTSIEVYNNDFNGGRYGVLWSSGSDNISIYNNNFLNFNFSTISGYALGTGSYYSTNNISIYNNNFNNMPRALELANNNMQIYDNIINYTDVGIRVSKGKSNNVYNNIIDNSIMGQDSYTAGIIIEYNVSNSNIYNNTIVRYGSSGIYVRQTKNISIYNNYLNQETDLNKLNNPYNLLDTWRPTFAIGIIELYKGWTGDSTENRTKDNFTNKMVAYNNTNINIYNNTFGNNVQTYLFIEGNYNNTIDLIPNNNNWYRKIRLVPEQTDTYEFYNNNNFNELTHVSYNENNVKVNTNTFFQAYSCSRYLACVQANYTISKTSMKLVNINHTISDYNTMYNLTNNLVNVSIFNALSFSPFNDIKNFFNGVILSSNVDNYSLTLSPNQQIEVGSFNIYVNFTVQSSYGVANGYANVFVYGTNDLNFNNLTIQLLDSNMNVINEVNSNSSITNTSFTSLTDNSYYVRIVERDTSGNVDSSNIVSFSMGTNGSNQCTNASHGLWLASIIVLIVGMLYLLFTTEFTIVSLIVLTVAIYLIGYLITLMSSSC